MDFIEEIREKIGHDEIPMVAVTALIFNRNDEILLIERTDNKKWSFPGGGLELREKVMDCLKREVFEETGLIVENAELVAIISGEDGVLKYPNEDVVSYTNLVFHVKKYKGQIASCSSEALSINFFGISNIPENLNGFVEKKMICKWGIKNFGLEID